MFLHSIPFFKLEAVNTLCAASLQCCSEPMGNSAMWSEYTRMECFLQEASVWCWWWKRSNVIKSRRYKERRNYMPATVPDRMCKGIGSVKVLENTTSCHDIERILKWFGDNKSIGRGNTLQSTESIRANWDFNVFILKSVHWLFIDYIY